MKEQVDALIDAYSEVRVQENVEGIATNKEVYSQVQKLMKDDHNIDQTVKQVEFVHLRNACAFDTS